MNAYNRPLFTRKHVFFLFVNSLVYWSPQGYKVVEVQTIVNGRIHNDLDKIVYAVVAVDSTFYKPMSSLKSSLRNNSTALSFSEAKV